MKRKEFLATGMVAALGGAKTEVIGVGTGRHYRSATPATPVTQDFRAQFPRLEREVFLNGGGGTPLSAFTAAAAVP